ncbi:MAG: O-antigen ligase family protein [Anaerolineae bacterium]
MVSAPIAVARTWVQEGQPTPRVVLWLWGALALACGLLLAWLPLPLAALVVAGVALVVGTLIEPLIGIGAALLLGPLRAWLEIRAPGALPHVGQAVLLFGVGVWLARGLLLRNVRLTVPRTMLLLLAFLGVSLISLWRAVDAWDGALEFVKWLQVAIVAAVVYERLTVSRGTWRVMVAVAGIAGAAMAQALIGLWQFGFGGTAVEEFAIDDRFFRAYGTFQQPNPYAGLLGLAGAVLLGLGAEKVAQALRSREPGGAVPALAALGPGALVLAGLVASWSRGGWMGFAAAVLVMVALWPQRSLWGVVLVALVLVVGGGLAVMGHLPESVLDRLTGFLVYVRFEDVRGVGITDANFSVIERMAHWQAALGMWREQFWLGVGLGGYEAAYPAHALIDWPLPLGHAHNFYLNLLAEVGLIGLAVYLAWLGSMAVGLLGALRRHTGWVRGLALGLAGAWTHLAVHSLVDNLLVNNVHLFVGVLVALTAWIVGQGERT